MVHLQYTGAARRAVMGSVRLAALTFLAEALLAVGFYRDGRGGDRFGGGEVRVGVLLSRCQ